MDATEPRKTTTRPEPQREPTSVRDDEGVRVVVLPHGALPMSDAVDEAARTPGLVCTDERGSVGEPMS